MAAETKELAVFAVDDQTAFLKAAAAVVTATDGMRLVGCATSGRSAVERLSVIGDEIDLVLLDVQLGDIDGFEVARRLHETWPDLPVAYVSMLDSSEVPDDLVAEDGIALISKAAFGPDALERVVADVADGLR